MDDELAIVRIQSAKESVMAAEGDLARLLSELRASPRAEKTTVSEALLKAFDSLREAREQLLMLEKLARAQDP